MCLISRFGPGLQSPSSRIGAGCQLKPCRYSILSSLSCWTLALACLDFPSEVRCQVAVIPGKCLTLKHASSAAGACSCWRPDQVGVPPMFLCSCLAAARAGGLTSVGGAGSSCCCGRAAAATSLVAQLLLACLHNPTSAALGGQRHPGACVNLHSPPPHFHQNIHLKSKLFD